MPQFNFNHLYYFHCVASDGSLAQAARRLRISQSTISVQIKDLETFLDQRLFNRPPGGGLILTDAGRRVFEHTTTMFSISSQLFDAFHQGQTPTKQVIEVGIVSAASRVFSAQFFLPLFQLKNVLPRIRSGNHNELFQALLARELDLLLSDVRLSEGESDYVTSRVIRRAELVAVASPTLGTQVLQFPRDLEKIPYIGYTSSSPTRLDLVQWFQECQVKPSVCGESDDVAMMLEVARAGLCFAIIPKSVAGRCLKDGSIVELGIVAHDAELSGLYRSENMARFVDDAIESLILGNDL